MKSVDMMKDIKLGDLGSQFNPAQVIKDRGLPKGWKLATEAERVITWHNQSVGLLVTMGSQKQEDEKFWIQIVIRRRSRIPSQEDLILVRNLFTDKDDFVYQIFPPQNAGYDKNLLELWICPGEAPLWKNL